MAKAEYLHASTGYARARIVLGGMVRPLAILWLALAGLGAVAVNGQTPERPRVFLLFVDDLHLDFRQTPRTRQFMKDLIARLGRDGDVWSVVTSGPSSISIPPTTDRDTVRAAVSRVTGNSLKIDDQRPGTSPERQNRATVAYQIAADAIARLAAVPNRGPLTVLYISGGYDTRAVTPPSAVVAAAVRVDARIIPIWPWTLNPVELGVAPDVWDAYVAATQEALRILATETSGMAVLTPADLEPAMRLVDSSTSIR